MCLFEKKEANTFYQLARPLNSPQPPQKPHPPILVGGPGEHKTLWLVAQYADACNLMGYLDKDVRQQKLARLREHCQALGRPYEEREMAMWTRDHSFPTSYAQATWRRLLLFFQLPGTITQCHTRSGRTPIVQRPRAQSEPGRPVWTSEPGVSSAS